MAVLILVGGLALLSRFNIDNDTLSPRTWSRVPHDEGVFGGEGNQEMLSVTVGGPGLVAVGWDGSDTRQDAAAWTSSDGITWSRVPNNEAAFVGEDFQSMSMTSVATGGPGLVAVGLEFSYSTGQVAAVWTSSNGITWSRVPHDEEVFGSRGGFQQMLGVTVGGPGLVAVGWGGFNDREDAAVWTSSDGITWSRVPHDEEVFGSRGGFQQMLGVTVGGPGLVAVGRDWSGGDEDAAVWTSSDGITWSRVPHDEAAFGGEGNQWMASVTTGGSGLVAVGSDTSALTCTTIPTAFLCDADSDAAVWKD